MDKTEFLNKIITISREDFLKASAKATSSEAMQTLTHEMPMMFMVLALYSAEIASELFDKSDAEDTAEDIEDGSIEDGSEDEE